MSVLETGAVAIEPHPYIKIAALTTKIYLGESAALYIVIGVVPKNRGCPINYQSDTPSCIYSLYTNSLIAMIFALTYLYLLLFFFCSIRPVGLEPTLTEA